MALKSISELLTTVSGRFTRKQLQNLGDGFKVVQATNMSDPERRALLKKAAQSEAVQSPVGMSFMDYVKSISRDIARDRIENDRIMEMAPEISQAATIMIPSIMAPNDLRESEIRITCDSKDLEPDQQKKISDDLTKFFEDTLNFSTELPKWIEAALYRAGSKPLLLVPLGVFDEKLSRKQDMLGTTSLESLTDFKSFVRDSVDRVTHFGISNAPSSTATESVRTATEDASVKRIMLSTESIVSGHIENYVSELNSEIVNSAKPSDKKNTTYNRDTKKTRDQTAYENFVRNVISFENLVVTDNPDAARASKSKNDHAVNQIGQKVKTRFTEAPLIVLENPDSESAPIGNPVFMELPAEAVIPIYTPGTPNDHIGYFIMLDERGHPLDIADFNQNGIHASPDMPNQNNFTQLFQSFGYANLPTDQRGQDVVSSVYQSIVESHLQDRLENAGFADVSLGANSSIFRYLFSRYLQQRRSKILFVPKEMLTYFAFKHNQNGVGVSKLDDVKFILSLRITLLTCRMLAAFNAAIDRRKINVNFDNKFAGDVLENLKTLQREYIRKSAVTFTHDPMNIAQQVAGKSISIHATGIPGIPNYTIENEPNERGTTSIDDSLAEDLKNLLILALDVPAAAMNSLAEAEYSRSVATTNLFFSRKLVNYQKIVCAHMNDFVRKYIMFSTDAQKLILDQITDSSTTSSSSHTDKNDSEEKGVVSSKEALDSTKKFTPRFGRIDLPEGQDAKDHKQDPVDDIHGEVKAEPDTGTKTKKMNKDLADIIQSISIFLPPPNIAPDAAQFENMEKMINSVNTLVAGLYPDDAAAQDADLAQAITATRSHISVSILQEFMQSMGFTSVDIPDPSDIDPTEILKYRQTLANVANAIRAHEKFIFGPGKIPIDDPSFNAGGGMGGMGGGFGADGGMGMDGGMGGGMDGGFGGDQGGSFDDFSQGAGSPTDDSLTGDISSDANPNSGSAKGNTEDGELI